MAIAAAGCLADLGTKRWVFDWLGPPPSKVWWIWKDYVGLETSVNTGALFGMGQGQTGLLIVVSVAALAGIGYWLWWGGATRDGLVTLAIGLILGGVLGNLYDRLGCWGDQGVRDWILLRYRRFTWPNFNIADSLLVIGAALLAIHALRPQHRMDKVPPEVTAATHVE
jgi:signal peptidase II